MHKPCAVLARWVLHVQSPAMVTDVKAHLYPDSSGFHYCKLLSPARAMEWIYVDGLRRYDRNADFPPRFPQEEQQQQPQQQQAFNAGLATAAAAAANQVLVAAQERQRRLLRTPRSG